jgi:isoleucyl-tRNA synthetase
MYQNLVKAVDASAPNSVHHQDWPTAERQWMDKDLMDEMDLAMLVASLGHSARNSANIRLRQPLAKATVVADARQQMRLEHLSDIVLDELNVKELEFVREADELVHYEIGLNPRLLGPKHGVLFPRLRAAVAEMRPLPLVRALQAGEPIHVEVQGTMVEVLPAEAEVRMRAREGLAVADASGIVVGINTSLTPELVREGTAQDIVRRIQDARKNAGLEIEDRIVIIYQADEQLRPVFDELGEYIASETLAVQMSPGPLLEASHTERFEIGGAELQVSVKRVE